MRTRLLTVLLIILGVSAVAVVGVAGFRSARVEYRYPFDSRQVTLPHAVSTVPTMGLWTNQRVVAQAGKDGVAVRYRYFEERWVEGVRAWRREIHPADKPSTLVVSEPATEVIEVGRRRGTAYEVNAAAENGQPMGRIPASGVLRFEIHGSVTFAGPETVSTPFGNTTYAYYRTPYRPDIHAGAALFRLAAGPWLCLRDLPTEKGTYLLRGTPGEAVTSVVNDAPGYFGDNRGAFEIIVWPDGVKP